MDEDEAERVAAEEKFKLLGEALEIMEDQMKRQLYDEGYDKEAIAERVEAVAHRITRTSATTTGNAVGNARLTQRPPASERAAWQVCDIPHDHAVRHRRFNASSRDAADLRRS